MVDFIRPTCWENEAEWKLVYDLLFRSKDVKVKLEGLMLIEVWRCRSVAKLPIAVDCTACLLGAITEGPSSPASAALISCQEETFKRLAMSMALVRFVNGMADEGQKGVYARSVNSLAAEIGIPEWLVNLRHDATHASLPSLELLETACHVALDWLRLHYWEKTLEMFSEPKSHAAADKINDFIHQYLHEYWPLKKADDKFFSSFGEMIKGVIWIDAMRNSIVPSLITTGVLLPSKIQIEELKHRGCKEPLKEVVEFWKPLILWLQEKNSQFITLIIDSLLQHFEENYSECEARKFASQFILTFVTNLQFDLRNEELLYRILKHCLLDTSNESSHLLSEIKGMIEIRNVNQTDIENLRDIFIQNEDIFTKQCLAGDSQTTVNNSRLQEYFAATPIAGVNLKSLLPAVYNQQADVLASWSNAAGPSWASVQEGRSLHCFEPISVSSVNSSLLKLPDDVDAAFAKALEVASESESHFDIAYSTIAGRITEEHDTGFDREHRIVIPPYNEPDKRESYLSEGVVLF